MQQRSVSEWLAWQETLNSKEIELGLERVATVYNLMQLDFGGTTVITVAGTNGKGSTVEMLAAILGAAGHKVGTYTSPHMFRYNERICINRVPVSDETLCQAFEAVESVRGDVPLTYFEFGTLAAFWCFRQQNLDIIILEVGLGGRLDAVNLIDPQISVITSIGIDHVEWLGKDRNAIAREKAGILRKGNIMVCGDVVPPMSLQEIARELSVKTFYINYDFVIQKKSDHWDWSHVTEKYQHLPFPRLDGEVQLRNAACALMVVTSLQQQFPVSEAHIHKGLKSANLPGRYQTISGKFTQVFDVAHNPQSCKELAKYLEQHPVSGRTHALVGMLKDKDFLDCVLPLMPLVDDWYVASLQVSRGADAADLAASLRKLKKDVFVHSTAKVTEAYDVLMQTAQPGDKVVVFGSFHTLAQVLPQPS
ncbi:MAG: bifunctional tetrahydrofolate synthase/dihydrofolate synthase [Gammaproteobacteria bacterium]|nr:bifunctional tetrahydrofolate synthase/dihydrofolate synthase [Gammaproteobacteria bacterium]MDH5800948.1 bifunctional tetrahydrofolate synthase/dihydrofolate synthase [Gammaproteobacteria bacterium]